MKKLTLDLDTLAVESFDSTPDLRGFAGTVHGQVDPVLPGGTQGSDCYAGCGESQDQWCQPTAENCAESWNGTCAAVSCWGAATCFGWSCGAETSCTTQPDPRG